MKISINIDKSIYAVNGVQFSEPPKEELFIKALGIEASTIRRFPKNDNGITVCTCDTIGIIYQERDNSVILITLMLGTPEDWRKSERDPAKLYKGDIYFFGRKGALPITKTMTNMLIKTISSGRFGNLHVNIGLGTRTAPWLTFCFL